MNSDDVTAALVAAGGLPAPPPPPRQKRLPPQQLGEHTDQAGEWRVSVAAAVPIAPLREPPASLPAWLLKQRDDLFREATDSNATISFARRQTAREHGSAASPHSGFSGLEFTETANDDSRTVTDSSEVRAAHPFA